MNRREFLKITGAALLAGCTTLAQNLPKQPDGNKNKIADDLERLIESGEYEHVNGRNFVSVDIRFTRINLRDIDDIKTKFDGYIQDIFPQTNTIFAVMPAYIQLIEEYAKRDSVVDVNYNYKRK